MIMPVSRRYSPEWAPGDSSMVGMDFSALIPPGAGIAAGSLQVTPTPGFTIGPAAVDGRTVYAPLTGGVAGTDYSLTWTVTDTDGNVWNRTAKMLCAPTS
jgi:hypothetical protein